MKKAIIVYYASPEAEKDAGATEYMARLIADEIKKGGIEVVSKKVGEVANIEELLEYDAIVVGTPCYLGNMAAPIKEFFDRSYHLLGKLEGKIGGAFATSKFVGGGNETAIMAINQVFLVHGMIIKGDSKGDSYGPVAISPLGDIRSFLIENPAVTARFGKKIADLVKKLGSS